MKDWPYPKLIAHRAGGTVAPENTLAAIRLAASLGYRTVEVDVRFSRDEVAVLQHDAKLERNTDGHGALAAQDWARLATLDAGAWRGEAYRGERLCRLDEAAVALRAARIAPHVEIKRIPGEERARGARVAGLVADLWSGAAERPLLISFSDLALEGARECQPGIDRGWIVEPPWDGELGPLERVDAVSIHLHHHLVSQELVGRVHGAGRRVLAWTVNDARRAAELLAWGVDGIVTDNVREFATRFRTHL